MLKQCYIILLLQDPASCEGGAAAVLRVINGITVTVTRNVSGLTILNNALTRLVFCGLLH